MKALFLLLVAVAASSAAWADSSHLTWIAENNGKRLSNMTCLYGEVEVFATGPTIYFCGCNWWPGCPAGGYCGIQDAGSGRRLTIFSVWDTTAALHTQTLEAAPHSQHSRFGGEGEGDHILLDHAWPLNTTFRYFVTKEQDAAGANTLTRMYFYDEAHHVWIRQGTISAPNNGSESVGTFGGGLNSFLENWGGQCPEMPKLAVYRLWIGNSPSQMINLCEARGDGKFGMLGDDFYLAEGEDGALEPVFQDTGKAVTKCSGATPLMKVRPRPIPQNVVKELETLLKS